MDDSQEDEKILEKEIELINSIKKWSKDENPWKFSLLLGVIIEIILVVLGFSCGWLSLGGDWNLGCLFFLLPGIFLPSLFIAFIVNTAVLSIIIYLESQ